MCHKISYESRITAHRQANQAGQGSRVYWCKQCQNWHLTTTASNVYKQRRKALRRDAKVTEQLREELGKI